MKSSLLLLISLVSFSAFAGGDETNNGAGGGEFYIAYARQTLPRLLDACSASPVCRNGVAQELRQIQERKPWGQTELRFLTSRELGSDVFRIKGPIIEINKFTLHKNSSAGSRPWEFHDAVAFLIRLYGEWAGLEATAVGKLSRQVAELSLVGSYSATISDASYAQFSLARFAAPLSTLIIEDLKGLSDSLEVPFTAKLDCSLATETEGPLQDAQVESAYWAAVNAHSTRVNSVISVTGRLMFKCPDDQGRLQMFRSNYRVAITIRPERKKEDDRWVMDPSTLTIEQSAIEEVKR